MDISQTVSAYCDLRLESYDTRIQELFAKAAFAAILEAQMDIKASISEHNTNKLKRLISAKFNREWRQVEENNPETIVQYLLNSSTCSQCIDVGCKSLQMSGCCNIYVLPILIYQGVYCCTKVCNLHLDDSFSKSRDNRMH